VKSSMKKETGIWLNYAEENISSANLLFANNLFNPCLQNCQQAIEKLLKSIFIESDIKFKRTHSIQELINILSENKINVAINNDEIELIDSIYMPSKYPLMNALPDFVPNRQICSQCIDIVISVKNSVFQFIK
jgi:HEPN domain-containing protein